MKADFCVVGGGIAGLSIAYELGANASVVLLERERDLAYHTTGRSAALYTEVALAATTRALSRLSRPFFHAPTFGFSEYPLHHEIGCLYVATQAELGAIEDQARDLDGARILDIDEMLARVPVLRTGDAHLVTGLLEPRAFRIDVGALVSGYRSGVRARGGEIHCNAEVVSVDRDGVGWRIRTANGAIISASKLINAAGAWGDAIAGLAALAPLELKPLRRTMIVFDGPVATKFSAWPAVAGIRGGFYFLPESGRLMGSSADEIPASPCDVQPEEYDVAVAAHSIETKTTLRIERIRHKWAGLRTFAPDRQLVAGYDHDDPNFFWFVGQGGFGIQTAPAAAHAAAKLALGQQLPDAYAAVGITAASLAPRRFGRRAA